MHHVALVDPAECYRDSVQALPIVERYCLVLVPNTQGRGTNLKNNSGKETRPGQVLQTSPGNKRNSPCFQVSTRAASAGRRIRLELTS